MPLQTGVHCFYASVMKNPKANDPKLYWLYFDGSTFTNQMVDLGSLTGGAGVSALRLGDRLYIHYVSKEKRIYQITYDGNSFTNHGYIQGGVQTQDCPAAVTTGGRLIVYYRCAETKTIKFTEEKNSQWTPPRELRGPDGKTIPLDQGPAAAVHGSDIWLAYSRGQGFLEIERPLKLLRLRGDTVTDESPPLGKSLVNCTPAVSIAGDTIFVMHHGWMDDRRLLCISRRVHYNYWSDDQPVPDALLNDGPGSCVYGDRVYCFMQGTNGLMYCQVYMGNRWLERNVKVEVNKNPLPNVWWGPCAVAV